MLPYRPVFGRDGRREFMAGLAGAVAWPLVARAQQTDRVVRSDLHPEIVYLLLKAMLAEHSEPGIFQRAGEFPKSHDEYPLAESAVEFYKTDRRSCNGTYHCGCLSNSTIDCSTRNSYCGRYPIVPLFAVIPLERAPTIALLVRSTSSMEATINSNSGGRKTAPRCKPNCSVRLWR